MPTGFSARARFPCGRAIRSDSGWSKITLAAHPGSTAQIEGAPPVRGKRLRQDEETIGRNDAECRTRWGERGDPAGFRADEARVVAYLQHGYRTGAPPNVDTARHALGDTLTRLWVTGSAADLLDHYFTADYTTPPKPTPMPRFGSSSRWRPWRRGCRRDHDDLGDRADS